METGRTVFITLGRGLAAGTQAQKERKQEGVWQRCSAVLLEDMVEEGGYMESSHQLLGMTQEAEGCTLRT